MSKIPNIVLNNGKRIPVLGMGTWQSNSNNDDELKEALLDSIDMGYRHFDCAFRYGNEKIIGDAIQQKINEGVVTREDLFITSKLGNSFHKTELVEPAIKESLIQLQLDYLDLYLIHWPVALKEGLPEWRPTSPDAKIEFSDADYVDAWKGMEEVYKKGLAKAIGVSNFNSKQLERLLKNSTVVPVINQVECHPYLNQIKLRDYCESKGIKITAYSPLGSPSRPWAKPGDPDVLNDNKIRKIAERYNKTPAQILIRYSIQLGNIVIPKSSNQKRLMENFNVFDFCLAPEDVAQIKKFDCNGRICPFLVAKDSPYYPFPPEVEY